MKRHTGAAKRHPIIMVLWVVVVGSLLVLWVVGNNPAFAFLDTCGAGNRFGPGFAIGLAVSALVVWRAFEVDGDRAAVPAGLFLLGVLAFLIWGRKP